MNLKPDARLEGGTGPVVRTGRRWATAAGLAVLVGATVAAYWPSLSNELVNWDDDQYVINNPHLRSVEGLRRIWVKMEASPQYYPLTFTGYWIQYQFWKDRAFGYHLVNVLLHAVNVVLVWRLIRKLEEAVRRESGSDTRGTGAAAWIGAGLFALHPVQVASVVWVAELKNVLSGMFAVSSMLLYVRYRGHGSWSAYAGSLVLFAGALLSKTATLTLPMSLLLMDLLLFRRGTWRIVLGLIPYGILVVGAAITTVLAEGGGGWDPPGPAVRPLIACAAVWFYLGKLVWPADLVAVYPRWEVWLGWWPGWAAIGGTVLAAGAVAVVRKRLDNLTLWGLGHFLVSLVPMLGFVPFGYMEKSFVADHFLYIASIGIFLTVGEWLERAGWGVWGRRTGQLGEGKPMASPNREPTAKAVGHPKDREPSARAAGHPWVVWVIAGVVLTALGVQTWFQTQVWSNSERLWRHTLARNPRSWVAENNLGIVCGKRGDQAEAIQHYRRSIEIHPRHAEGYNNLGAAEARLRRYGEAIQHYRKAIEYKRGYADAHQNLGSALVETGQLEEAARQFAEVLRIRPGSPQAHHGLGRVYAIQRKWPEAIAEYRKALASQSDYLDAHTNLGAALDQAGQFEEALEHYRRALELSPKHAPAHLNTAMSLARRGQAEEAEREYRLAIESDPNYVEPYYNFGNFLANRGRLEEAIEQYRRSIALRPGHAESYVNLGNALRNVGRTTEAIAQYRSALQVRPDHAAAGYNLAMTLADTGDYGGAVALLQQMLKQRPSVELGVALAWIWSTCPAAEGRNGAGAVEIAKGLVGATRGQNPQVLDVLGAGLAETGQFEEAAKTATGAAELAERQGLGDFAREIRGRVQLYRAGQSYRQPMRPTPRKAGQ